MAQTKLARSREQIRRLIVKTFAGTNGTKSQAGMMDKCLKVLQKHLDSDNIEVQQKALNASFKLLQYAIPTENAKSLKSLTNPGNTNSENVTLNFQLYLDNRSERLRALNPGEPGKRPGKEIEAHTVIVNDEFDETIKKLHEEKLVTPSKS